MTGKVSNVIFENDNKSDDHDKDFEVTEAHQLATDDDKADKVNNTPAQDQPPLLV